MILKGSRKPKDNLTIENRMALQTLRANETLKVLPVDKGNVTLVLATADYNWRTTPTGSGRTPLSLWNAKLLLLRKFSISEEVYQQLWPHGFRHPRLHGLPKIHN